MKVIKSILQCVFTVLKVLFPKSRLGNIIWGILGVLLAQWDSFQSIVKAIIAVFAGS
jgi:hypothetical protein